MALLTAEQRAFLPENRLPIRRERNAFLLATSAFFAMLIRDLLVIRRQLISFLVQVLIQPLFLFFVFGKILPDVGFTTSDFGAVFLPGVVGFTIILTALQGVTMSLSQDLGYAREIDDRLLAPLPVSMVALEKIVFASLRGLIAGAAIFPLAYLLLGNSYHVRTDEIGTMIGIMVLAALASASLGMTIGTLIRPDQTSLMLSLTITPMMFLGCAYYPWSTLGSIRWFQIVTLFNPLTYTSEGLRAAMLPTINGHVLPTLGIGWVLLGLGTTIVVFMTLGIKTFYHRVIR